MKKFLFFGLLQLLLLVLHIIPVVGQIAYVITNTILSSYVFAFEFVSLPLERLDLSFSAKRAFLRQEYGRNLGFGLTCLGLFLISILNAFTLPLCVVSGTLIYCQQVQKSV